jgi:pimeloyl-ACP methyl ester carboxylesterase
MLNYELMGKGDYALVVETALSSTFAEWKPILEPLSNQYLVFLYDRAGYGDSDEATTERTPKVIAYELNALIRQVIPDKKYIFVGHSVGGLYVQQYVRDYPKNIVGAVFLDPATTNENVFKSSLTPKEYKKSGIDKSMMLKLGVVLGRLGLLQLFKPLLKKSIPFYYYKNYDAAAETQILNHLTQLKSYKASLREYQAYLKQEEVAAQLNVNPFPKIPVRVLYHNPQVMIEEIMNFGRLTETEATHIEHVWRTIIENSYVHLSDDYFFEIAEKSGHFIHLTDQELLLQTIQEVRKAIPKN